MTSTKGHGGKLSRKREKRSRALLTESTRAKAGAEEVRPQRIDAEASDARNDLSEEFRNSQRRSWMTQSIFCFRPLTRSQGRFAAVASDKKVPAALIRRCLARARDFDQGDKSARHRRASRCT